MSSCERRTGGKEEKHRGWRKRKEIRKEGESVSEEKKKIAAGKKKSKALTCGFRPAVH